MYKFRLMLVANKTSIEYLNEAIYIQKILKTRPLRSTWAKALSRPNFFDMQIYFQVIMVSRLYSKSTS